MDPSKYFNVFNSVNLLGVLVLTLIFYHIKHSKEKSKYKLCASLLEGPKTIPFFGNSLDFILHPTDIAITLIRCSEKYGSRCRLWIGQKFAIVISNAEDSENALNENKFLNKGADFHDLFGRVFKNGTFSAEGTDWKRSRKILQLPLKTNVMEDYIPVMNEEAARVIKKLQPMANTGETFDVGSYIASATFNIVCSDITLPANTEIIINVPALHKNSKYFPNPETFDPERFSKEKYQELPKGCYIPFVIGPRNCIGKAFSMYEMKIICSTILRKYRIHTEMKQEDIKLRYSFVSGSAVGYKVSISERNK